MLDYLDCQTVLSNIPGLERGKDPLSLPGWDRLAGRWIWSWTGVGTLKKIGVSEILVKV